MKKRGEALSRAIETYFASLTRPMLNAAGEAVADKNGAPLMVSRAATVSGLALFLGYRSREELERIGTKKEKALVERALLRIEAAAEEKLFEKDCFQGAKLFLSVNFKRWRTQETEMENAPDLGVCSLWAE